MPTAESHIRLSASFLPLMALLFDLLATLQGEAVWRYAAIACVGGALGLLLARIAAWRARGELLVAWALMAASLGLWLIQPLSGSSNALAASGCLGVAVLVSVWRGALLGGVGERRRPLLELLEWATDEVEPEPARLKRAS